MLGVVADHLKDASVLRRLLFVATYLSRELPNFWGIAVEFATAGKAKSNAITPEMAEAIVENIHSFDANAFCTDKTLHQELIGWDLGNGKVLGVVLIPSEKQCVLCGSKLTLRRDRPSSIVVYDDSMGTLPGSLFHKICSIKQCSLTQYYGYYTKRGSSEVIFNSNWRLYHHP